MNYKEICRHIFLMPVFAVAALAIGAIIVGIIALLFFIFNLVFLTNVQTTVVCFITIWFSCAVIYLFSEYEDAKREEKENE